MTPESLLLCPTCGQTLPTKLRRECARCHQPILKGEKYTFQGCLVLHRRCDEPRIYEQPREVLP